MERVRKQPTTAALGGTTDEAEAARKAAEAEAEKLKLELEIERLRNQVRV